MSVSVLEGGGGNRYDAGVARRVLGQSLLGVDVVLVVHAVQALHELTDARVAEGREEGAQHAHSLAQRRELGHVDHAVAIDTVRGARRGAEEVADTRREETQEARHEREVHEVIRVRLVEHEDVVALVHQRAEARVGKVLVHHHQHAKVARAQHGHELAHALAGHVHADAQCGQHRAPLCQQHFGGHADHGAPPVRAQQVAGSHGLAEAAGQVQRYVQRALLARARLGNGAQLRDYLLLSGVQARQPQMRSVRHARAASGKLLPAQRHALACEKARGYAEAEL